MTLLNYTYYIYDCPVYPELYCYINKSVIAPAGNRGKTEARWWYLVAA